MLTKLQRQRRTAGPGAGTGGVCESDRNVLKVTWGSALTGRPRARGPERTLARDAALAQT